MSYVFIMVTVATFAHTQFTTILSGFGFVPGKLNLQNAHI